MAVKLVFLDRDGVINRFPGRGEYLVDLEKFEFLPRALDGIRLLTESGFELHVVTNQGCVSRGLIAEKDLLEMHKRMNDAVAREGGRLAGVHTCPHQTSDACSCKKPKTELFLRALAGRPVEKRRLFFVGDSAEDVEAGHALGCRTVVVLSGRMTREEVAALPKPPEKLCSDLLEAAQWIARQNS